MRGLLPLQVKYNQHVNQKMYKILNIFNKELLYQDNIALENLIYYVNDHFYIQLELINNYTKLCAICYKIDSLIIEMIFYVQNLEKEHTLLFPRLFTQTKIHFMLALFNDLIHHRRQIAAILDHLQIPNNFSGMLSINI